MSHEIELYRGPEFAFAGRLPLMSFVRPSLERLLGGPLDRAAVGLEIIDVPGSATPAGEPAVFNLVPEYGYAHVTVARDDRVVYQHPHPLDEVLTQELQAVLRARLPDVAVWGFRVDVPGMPPAARVAVRPTPEVSGRVLTRPYAPGESAGFAIRRLAEDPPPEAGLADFGLTDPDPGRAAPVKVLVPRRLRDDLCGTRPLSAVVEEGGFLVGRAYRDRDQPDAFLLRLTDAPTAERTGASMLHLTFTGDSFSAVKRGLREGQSGDRLLGWFHTHLFPATDEMGLSSVDLRLHFSTFTIPWQVAGLINLDGAGRTLRFYVRRGDGMALCPDWTVDE